jgi:hypothetical protein
MVVIVMKETKVTTVTRMRALQNVHILESELRGNNAFINCGHCITDCCYSLGYTVLTWVTTPCSLTFNYQLLNATSTPTTEAAYLPCFLLPMNYKDPSTCL